MHTDRKHSRWQTNRKNGWGSIEALYLGIGWEGACHSGSHDIFHLCLYWVKERQLILSPWFLSRQILPDADIEAAANNGNYAQLFFLPFRAPSGILS